MTQSLQQLLRVPLQRMKLLLSCWELRAVWDAGEAAAMCAAGFIYWPLDF